MRKLFALSLVVVGVAWGQADTRFETGDPSPLETGTISFANIETYPSFDVVFEDESGLTIVKIDLDTGNVTIADGIGMNEASRKFWKLLQQVAGRQENCDASPTTGDTRATTKGDPATSTNLKQLEMK